MIGVGAIVAVIFIGLMSVGTWRSVNDEGDAGRGSVSAGTNSFLTQADFPSGYVYSALGNLNTWEADLRDEMSVTTEPAQCHEHNIDEIKRNKNRVRAGVQAQNPSRPDLPGYTETVSRYGEQLRDVTSVLTACPTYTRVFPGEGRTILDMRLVNAPGGCPREAMVIRSTTRFTPDSVSAESESSSKALDGYAVVGDATVVVSQVQTLSTANLDQSQFCQIFTRAVDLMHDR